MSFTTSFSSPRTHSIKKNGIKSKKAHLISEACITEVTMYVRRIGFWKFTFLFFVIYSTTPSETHEPVASNYKLINELRIANAVEEYHDPFQSSIRKYIWKLS